MNRVMILLLLIFAWPRYCSCDQIAPNNDVAELSQEFFNFRIANSPEYATKFGITSDNATIEDKIRYGVSAIGDDADDYMIKSSKDFLKRSLILQKKNLNHEDKVTISILKDILQTYIDGSEFKDYGQFSTIRTYFTEVLRIIKWMPKVTERDAQDIIHRITLQSENFKKVILRLKKSSGKNIFDYNLAVVANINDLKLEINRIDGNITDSLFYKEFALFNSDILTKYEREIEAILRNDLKDAMIEMVDYLEKEYLPASRMTAGVWSLPRGDDYYKACLKWHLSIDVNKITPQDIHDIGVEQVAIVEEKMKRMIKSEQPDGDLKEFKKRIYSNPKYFYKNKDELKTSIEKHLDMVHSKLDRVFKTISKEKLKFVLSFDPHGPGAFYTDPSLNGSKPGEYSLNIRALQSPKFTFPTLNLHEAEPGHHSQSVTIKLTNAPIFRKLIEYRKYPLVPFNWPFYTAITEGWALYAESLGDELDAYEEEYSEFGYLASSLFRASRIVVDTGIHYKKWSKSKAADYFKNHTFLSDAGVDSELNRYITTPGQACSYKIGELHILKELKIARQAIGAEFDKREFHDLILKQGSASLEQISLATKEFIKRKLSTNSADSLSLSLVSAFLCVFLRSLC